MTRWLWFSSVLTLVALALMVWSLLDQTLVPIMFAMSIAQALGTLALAVYLFVVFRDVTQKRGAPP